MFVLPSTECWEISYKHRLDVVEWKTDVTPQIGFRPQEVINRGVARHDVDIFLGIMWKRFGTPTGIAGSGTQEEFDAALAKFKTEGKPFILFYFSTQPSVPRTKDDIEQWGKVIDFRESLQQLGLVCEYESLEEFAKLLQEHLIKIIYDRFAPLNPLPPVGNFTRYVKYLQSEAMYMDVGGLMIGQSKTHLFRIDELYVPLLTTTAHWPSTRRSKRGSRLQEVLISDVIESSMVIIVGDPGSGKTTFLRLVTFGLCQLWLGGGVSAGLPNSQSGVLPIFVRLSRLVEHIQKWTETTAGDKPNRDDSPGWVLHFLRYQSQEFNLGLEVNDFHRELEGGRCTVLFDGLDEGPSLEAREQLIRLTRNFHNAYPLCHIVLTSRPMALAATGSPSGIPIVEIAPLDEAGIDQFLSQWSATLYPEAPEKSATYRMDLIKALRSRPEIRVLARTPVMLTALAIVHWNERRLPEQRAELYESILTWLFRAREERPNRLKADRCRKLLQKLAIAMFKNSGGRLRQIGIRDAAEVLSEDFTPSEQSTSAQIAELFLRDEMVDSGIILERGNRLEFWHLSFQEYLAACAIAGMLEEQQQKVLFSDERLSQPEWRELFLLLGGVLYKQGDHKVNHLVDSILAVASNAASVGKLSPFASLVSVLEGLVHDLSPFNFQPANPQYATTIRLIMKIFDKDACREVPLKLRLEAAEVLGRVGDPRLEKSVLVRIPGGRFLIGTQKQSRNDPNYDIDCQDSESPVHELELSAFEVSKYLVTVSQFSEFLVDGGYRRKEYWPHGGFAQFIQPESWEQQREHPIAALAFPLAAPRWLPPIAFDRTRPARDINSETVSGKPTPWGPSPASWLILRTDSDEILPPLTTAIGRKSSRSGHRILQRLIRYVYIERDGNGRICSTRVAHAGTPTPLPKISTMKQYLTPL